MTLLEHNEMVIHGTPPDLFKNTTTPGVKVYTRVTCTHWNETRGRICGALIARVEVGRWERDMASKAKLFCKDCKSEYSLADYL